MSKRIRISAILLAVSLLVLGAIFALVYGYWYPQPYFRIEGADRVFYIMVAAQLVLGPLLVLLLFKPGKKGLWLDMTVIGILQIAALTWGLQILYQDRPLFMVYAVDRFNVLAARDVDISAIGNPDFLSRPKQGPLLLVASMPSDPSERSRLAMATVFEGQPDIDRRPEYWGDYQQQLPSVLARASTVERVTNLIPELSDSIEQALASRGLQKEQVLFAPVRGVHADFALMLDRREGQILDAFEIASWF